MGNTTGRRKSRSSRISAPKKYDWEKKIVIQSYLRSRKIRLGEENRDPVVSPPQKNTTGRRKRRSSRISAPEKYDWEKKTAFQSYRIA